MTATLLCRGHAIHAVHVGGSPVLAIELYFDFRVPAIRNIHDLGSCPAEILFEHPPRLEVKRIERGISRQILLILSSTFDDPHYIIHEVLCLCSRINLG